MMRKQVQISLFLNCCLVALVVTILSGKHILSPKYISAETDGVKLFFNPPEAKLPPKTTISFMLDSQSYNIAFAHIELRFDKTMINLTDEISTTNLLGNVVSKTSKDQANETGRIIIVLAIDPGETPPTGVLEFAQLPITVVTGASNQITTISIVEQSVEIVDMTPQELPFTSEAANILLNLIERVYLPVSLKDYNTPTETPTCQDPGKPSLVSPSNGSITNDNSPLLDWNSASYSNEYQIQIDDNSSFSSPTTVVRSRTDYTPSLALNDGTHYWRVRGRNTIRGCDVYGNWSNVWSVNISADISGGLCDQFNAPTLKPGWTWIDPLGDSIFSLSANPGHLRLFTPDGGHDLYPVSNFNAPRLVQEISGDFVVTTKVDINPNFNYQGAGLLIWQDNNNYVRLERTLVKGIDLWYRIGGIYEGVEIPFSNSPVYLRLERVEDSFTAKYSNNGSNWTAVSTLEYPAAENLKVGLTLLNQWQDNPISADFDFFEVNECEAGN